MKLAEGFIVVKGIKRQFEFEGQVEVTKDGVGEPVFDFDDLVIYEKKGQVREPYILKGSKWNGEEYDYSDAIADVIGRYSRNEAGGFEMIYLYDEIKKTVDVYRQEIAVTVENRRIPKKILYNSMI